MKKSYKKILLTAFVTIIAFVSVTYVSCIKYTKNPASCDYHACENGGVCYHAACNCPAGYDSTYCNTRWVDKYPGRWTVSEVIVGSNFPWAKGQDSAYTINIRQGGTLTSLLVDSFLNNWYYHDIPLQITTSSTISFGAYFCPYNTAPAFSIKGGTGALDSTHTSITGTYYREIQAQLGTQSDTVNYTMTKL